MGQVRIGLTISGAVSLGAFEGGALAALLTGVQAAQALDPGKPPKLRVDAIGAASAGAITAVAAARVLTGGLDPVWVMEQAWVTRASAAALLHNAGPDAPLSMDGLSQTALDILRSDASPIDAKKIQEAPVAIRLVLANLRGFNYRIGRVGQGPRARPPLEASTYLDWGPFVFQPRADLTEFVQPSEASAVDTGLASGANQFGFSPKRLRRSAQLYEENGVTNFPPTTRAGDAFIWYSDGGTIDNEPLGQTLDISNDMDSDGAGTDYQRIQLLIHPFPGAPPPATSRAWADGDNRPTWLQAFGRAITIIRSQNLYSDLKHAEKTNSQIIWKERLANALDAFAQTLASAQQVAWHDALASVVDSIDTDRAPLPRSGQTPVDRSAQSARDLLTSALERIGGLSGKNAVGIEVITPFLAEGTAGRPLDQILAGEFLQSFGGFFDEGLRRSDFALGFVCMLNWMDTGLEAYQLTAEARDKAIDAALAAFYGLQKWPMSGTAKSFDGYGLTDQLKQRARGLGLQERESWTPTDFGRMTLGQLPLSERLLFGRIALRILAVALHDLWLRVTGRDKQ